MIDHLTPHEEEHNAIERLGASYDGQLLHRYLRRVLEDVRDLPNDGALQTHNGKRMLARDLMAIMAKGIEATLDRSSQPILSRAAEPVELRSRRGISRRGGDEPLDGWPKPAS